MTEHNSTDIKCCFAIDYSEKKLLILFCLTKYKICKVFNVRFCIIFTSISLPDNKQQPLIGGINSKSRSSTAVDAEFRNIREQIVRQLYAGFSSANLAKILNTVGCVNLDECQTLLDITNIEYVVNSISQKSYIGHEGPINKKIVHSFNITISNNGTSTRDFETPFQNMTFTQNFQLNISKTAYVTSNNVVITRSFTPDHDFLIVFGKNDTETTSINATMVVNAFPQTIKLEPGENINVTYNFYEYEELNYYTIGLSMDSTSYISHPTLDAHGLNVIFSKTLLSEHPNLVRNLKYHNVYGIRMDFVEKKTQIGASECILKNFPATERIVNYGVDLVYGEREFVYKSPEILLPENSVHNQELEFFLEKR